MADITKLTKILGEIRDEVARATTLHGPFHSLHEGYAILKEEVDEFWDEVKLKAVNRDPERIRKELTQVAAMAVRALHDLT